MSNRTPTALLLNAGHAIDHLFLLIFATAVATIAVANDPTAKRVAAVTGSPVVASATPL